VTGISKPVAYLTVILAQALGGASLLLLGVLLFRGPFLVVELGLSVPAALWFDGFLCLAFCAQHSVMVRQSFRRRLESVVPDQFHGAIYAIASGSVLTALIVLWQGAIPDLITLDGAARWLLRAVAVLAVLGMVWGVLSLGSFDAFGVRPLMAEVRGKESRETPLAVRGPYRWVRHPLYTCVLLLLWAIPDLSADRLILNVVWTLWVVLATMLEERDLVGRFGPLYRKYQREVPMLIPWRIPRSKRAEP
jgi:methanethiol S-methyltransferase